MENIFQTLFDRLVKTKQYSIALMITRIDEQLKELSIDDRDHVKAVCEFISTRKL